MYPKLEESFVKNYSIKINNNMSKFNSSFDRTKRQFNWIFVIAIAIIILSIAANIFVLSGNSAFKAIITTGYGKNRTTYYVKSYTEANGCIEFIDGFDFKHKVCDYYEITEKNNFLFY